MIIVNIGVVLNSWYAPFYDLIGKALSNPGSIKNV
ncbi:SbmA/BacA-like family transporter [Enterobacter roggenkampii]